MRQIFLDTETTGLSPETGDRVIEIGCIEMVNRRLTGNNRHYYLNPERPSSEEAMNSNGWGASPLPRTWAVCATAC
jgi:DNA polymerase-3 subunit epsilon